MNNNYVKQALRPVMVASAFSIAYWCFFMMVDYLIGVQASLYIVVDYKLHRIEAMYVDNIAYTLLVIFTYILTVSLVYYFEKRKEVK